MRVRWYHAALGALGAWGAYSLFRVFRDVYGAGITDEVAAKLPIAKDLPTVPDAQANYDIDGVSFDSEGVIVSSDANKPVEAPI